MPTPREEIATSLAVLLGAEFDYDDYGHPERASARQYWRIATRYNGGVTIYGYTQGDAAAKWLALEHNTYITESGTVLYNWMEKSK